MRAYLLGDDHWFRGFRRAWLVLARAECSCGWCSRPYWPSAVGLDGAASALILHQARGGTELKLPGSGGSSGGE